MLLCELQVLYACHGKFAECPIAAVDECVKNRAGVNQWDSESPPKYVNNTHLSARVGSLNPDWNEEQSDALTNERFQAAVALTGAEFVQAVTYCAKVGWAPC